jgi:hypothetical protein
MFRPSWRCALASLLVLTLARAAGGAPLLPALDQLGDGKSWRLVNAEFETFRRDGQSAVRLRPKGEPGPGSLVGMALIEGLPFAEGAIDIDLRGGGSTRRRFLGVAFAVTDERHFEAVYFRPFRFADPDKGSRAHAVQYVAWPNHTWERLRQEKPGVYEAALDPAPDPSGWFHARIEVTKAAVRVFVNGSKRPCLAVDRLGRREGGKVGLWVDSREGEFAGLTVEAKRGP